MFVSFWKLKSSKEPLACVKTIGDGISYEGGLGFSSIHNQENESHRH
jgi:hypothetical protein